MNDKEFTYKIIQDAESVIIEFIFACIIVSILFIPLIITLYIL